MVIYREMGGGDVPSPLKKELGWEGGELCWTIFNKASFVILYIYRSVMAQRQKFLSLVSNIIIHQDEGKG